MGDAAMTPRLTSAQASYLKRLHLDGGYARLSNAIYRTAMALHDKGMVRVTIATPVNGHIQITSDGAKVADAIIKLLDPVKRHVAEKGGQHD